MYFSAYFRRCHTVNTVKWMRAIEYGLQFIGLDSFCLVLNFQMKHFFFFPKEKWFFLKMLTMLFIILSFFLSSSSEKKTIIAYVPKYKCASIWLKKKKRQNLYDNCKFSALEVLQFRIVILKKKQQMQFTTYVVPVLWGMKDQFVCLSLMIHPLCLRVSSFKFAYIFRKSMQIYKKIPSSIVWTNLAH